MALIADPLGYRIEGLFGAHTLKSSGGGQFVLTLALAGPAVLLFVFSRP